jgi:hypothetical protein
MQEECEKADHQCREKCPHYDVCRFLSCSPSIAIKLIDEKIKEIEAMPREPWRE